MEIVKSASTTGSTAKYRYLSLKPIKGKERTWILNFISNTYIEKIAPVVTWMVPVVT